MTKKKEYTEAEVTPAPRFNTRAGITSGLDEFLEEIMSLCGGKFHLTFARSADSLAKKALDALEHKRKGYVDMATGLIASFTNDIDGKTEPKKVTVGMIEGWLSRFSNLAATYQSVGVLLTSLVKFGDRNTTELNVRATIRASTCTEATMMLQSPSVTYEYSTRKLLDSYRCRCVTDADRDFLYDHLRRNGAKGHEVLYWMGEDGAIVVPRDERSGVIPEGDDDFWNAFYAENDVKLRDILSTMEAAAYDYEQVKPEQDNGMPKTFDDYLLEIAPQCVARYAVLTKRLRKVVGTDGKASIEFDCFLIECQMGATDRGRSREKWKSALSRGMLSDLVKSEVRYAKQFSNTPGVGLVCIPLTGENADGTTWEIDTLGVRGKRLAEQGENPPELPSEFRRFFFGERGQMCIFQSDPNMSLLRIADFTYRILVEGTKCRQCLTLTGSGKDGKTALIQVLQGVLGLKEVTLNAEKIDDPASMYSVINAPLMVLPEVRKPSEVFKSSFFKSLTGGDSMQLKRLYHMPIDWTPEHGRLMMTTNNPVYLSGDAQVSRCLPVAMQQAYDPRTARTSDDIVASCLMQKREFLQWVCDLRAYYQALRVPNGDSTGIFMPDRLMIVTDEDFNDIMSGEVSLLDSTEKVRRIFERRAIEATGSGRFFVSYGDEAGDDEAEWYEILFNALLETDPEGSIARSELSKAVMSSVEINRITKQPRCPTAKLAIDALGISTTHIIHDRAFGAFKKWLDSEGKATLVKAGGIYRFKGVKLKEFDTPDDTAIEPDKEF